MTTITFFQDGERFTGFKAKGHAGYAEAGEDIVCAAVSALCQTAETGLLKVAGAIFDLEVSEEQAMRETRLAASQPSGRAEEAAQVILRTLWEGLSEIQEAYPEYVRTNIRRQQK